MGSNESFPPPPPPGQPPQPNWQQPGYQPTQQVPATQAYPQQGYMPEATPPKKGNGLLIGGGLVVVAALVGAVVLLTGGDDDDKKTTNITLASVPTSTAVVDTTIGGQITTPPTVAPTDPTTPETTASSNLIEVTDDTGTFSMILPNDLELDTSTITSTDGFVVPSISAAEVIASYNNDDVTFGLTAVAVGPEIGSDAAQVLAFLEPTEGTCTNRVEDTVETTHGLATRVSLTGCGAGGGNKVLMVVTLANQPFVLGMYLQGLADATVLAPAAQAALESMLVF